MNVLAWILAVTAAALASLSAAADGALLSPEPTDDGRRGVERERMHRALSIVRVLSYIACGASVAGALDVLPDALRWPLGIVLSLVVVGLAEGASRALGYSDAARTLRRLAWLMRVVQYALAPVVLVGERIDSLLHFVLPPPPADEEDREASTEQFREVVAAEADVSTAEEALIHGVFSLGDTEVREIMVPRVDMVGIEASTPWSEVLDRVSSSEHARFPVYDDTLDNVLGILYAKDLLSAVIADEEPGDGWRTLVRPAAFIPPTKTIDAQLRDFKASRTHIAIVSDEFGGTSGLVTIEDVLEEIVGEIRDEYDVDERDIEREGDSRFWIAGRVTVDELSEILGSDFAREDVTTVGGLVYELFGRVPHNGESVVSGGFRIVVERVRRRRIERVYFERLEAVGSRSGA